MGRVRRQRRAWDHRVPSALGGVLALAIVGSGASCSTDREFSEGNGGPAGDSGAPTSGDAGRASGGSFAEAGNPSNPGNGGSEQAGGSAGGTSCDIAVECECQPGETKPCGPSQEVGECRFGTQACVDGAWAECEGAVLARVRDCTSPLDNDCDGVRDDTMDEACVCVPGTTEACGENPGKDGNGPCTAGSRECEPKADSGVWGPCVGAVPPQLKDRCDTAEDDSDCDGEPNGGCTCVLGEKKTCSQVHASKGVCAALQLTCVSSGNWPSAANCESDQAEVCASDGKDEDCDGQVNEGCACTNGMEQKCGSCGAGSQTCVNGAWSQCTDVLTLTTPRGPRMLCVPPGTFQMGSVNQNLQDATPVHPVTLPGYWMDETEVTQAQYTACVSAGACVAAIADLPCQYGAAGHGTFPINCVNNEQAEAFCSWSGKRLPLEEEWEYAARGTDGRSYPWGNTVGAAGARANWGAPTGAPVAVGGYPTGKSPFGLFDMAGNVSEWTSSQFCSYPASGLTPPCGAEPLIYRGGGYNSDQHQINSAYRTYDVSFWAPTLGIRCAKSL